VVKESNVISDFRLQIAGFRFPPSCILQLVLCVLTSFAAAQVPIHDYVGEEVSWHNARTLANGGLAGLEPGPAAVLGNPAVLGLVRKPAASLTYGVKLATELRTRIVYDQFENAIGEVAIAENIHGFGLPGPLAGAYRLGPVGIGAGIAPVRDFSYYYYKEYRDDFYVKFGEDRVQQTGALSSGSVGLGVQPFRWLSIGAAGRYLYGTRRLEWWAINGADTAHGLDEGSPHGQVVAVGIMAIPLSRLSVGLDFQSGIQLAGWTSGHERDTARDYVGSIPWSARAAVSYRVAGVLPSIVSAEGKYAAWKSAASSSGRLQFSNLLTVKAGVEHTMLNFVRLRYGFGVEPMPYEPTIQRAKIGFGVGFDAGFARIDVGGLLTRDLIGPDDFYQPLSQTDLKIHESRNYFAITVSREF
jgi:hypothetical protein